MDPITAVIVGVVAYSITDVYYASQGKPRPSHQRWLDREERRAARGQEPKPPPGPLKRACLAAVQDWADKTETRLQRQQEKRRAREPARTKRQADRARRREQRKLARYYRNVRRFRAAREVTKDAAGRLIDQLQDAVWRPYEEQQAWDVNADWDANATGEQHEDTPTGSSPDEQESGARRRHLVALRPPEDPDREHREQQQHAREERDRAERERARASQQAFQEDQAQQQREHEWQMFLLHLYAEHAASDPEQDDTTGASRNGTDHGPRPRSEPGDETTRRTRATAERLDQDATEHTSTQPAELQLLSSGTAENEHPTEEEQVADTDTDQTVQTSSATISEITSIDGGMRFARTVRGWTTSLMDRLDAQRGEAVAIESDLRSTLSAIDAAVASLKSSGFKDNSTQIQRYAAIREEIEKSIPQASALQTANDHLINACDAVSGSADTAYAALEKQKPIQEQIETSDAQDGVASDMEFYRVK